MKEKSPVIQIDEVRPKSVSLHFIPNLFFKTFSNVANVKS